MKRRRKTKAELIADADELERQIVAQEQLIVAAREWLDRLRARIKERDR